MEIVHLGVCLVVYMLTAYERMPIKRKVYVGNAENLGENQGAAAEAPGNLCGNPSAAAEAPGGPLTGFSTSPRPLTKPPAPR